MAHIFTGKAILEKKQFKHCPLRTLVNGKELEEETPFGWVILLLIKQVEGKSLLKPLKRLFTTIVYIYSKSVF